MAIGREVLRFIKDKTPTKSEILKKFGLTQKDFEEVLKIIRGFDHDIVCKNRHYAVSKTFKKEEQTIVIDDGNLEPKEIYMADTHSSDKGSNFELFRKIIEKAYNSGFRIVFHAGDLVAGRNVYSGQVHDLNHLTFEQQVERLANTLPTKKDLEYYVINGNHDMNWMKNNAGNVGKALESMRSDIHFLGDGYGRVIKNGIKIDLVHFSGSGAYARSYKLQTYLRNYLQAKIEDRPHILIGGHLHAMLCMDNYGINCVLPGHFQGPNEYVKRMGLLGREGSVLVDYKIDGRKVTRFRTEFVP